MMTGINDGLAVTELQKEQFKSVLRGLVQDLVEPINDECKITVKKVGV